MKIYFYIRALYRDDMSPFSTEHVGIKSVNFFNSLSPITAQEYRDKLHSIQLRCIKNISDNIIYNIPIHTKELYKRPYNCVQVNSKQQLLELNDDDVVIPLDDDDWLSPNIKSIDFEFNSLTTWNTMWFNDNKLSYAKKVKKFENAQEYNEKESFTLSNCFAISARIIKKVIHSNNVNLLANLLQFHPHTRGVIRDSLFTEDTPKEYVMDEYYAMYVRHMCNDTNFRGFFEEGKSYTIENYNRLIHKFKSLDYSILDLPEDYQWSKSYFEELHELNKNLQFY